MKIFKVRVELINTKTNESVSFVDIETDDLFTETDTLHYDISAYIHVPILKANEKTVITIIPLN